MKRKKKKPQQYMGMEVCIKRKFPWIFWHSCEKCDKEFRREHGWEYIVFRQRYITWYICESCCANKDEVHEFFVSRQASRAANIKPAPGIGSNVIKETM